MKTPFWSSGRFFFSRPHLDSSNDIAPQGPPTSTKTPLEIVHVARGGRGNINMFIGNEGKGRVHPEREMKRSGKAGKGAGGCGETLASSVSQLCWSD